MKNFETSNEFTSQEAGMGEVISGKGLLTTRGISTCIFVAASNSETGSGVLAHLSDFTSKEQRELFEEALKASMSLGDPRHTSVKMGGGSHLTKDGELLSSSLRNREYAEHHLRQFIMFDPENVQVEWLQNDMSLDLTLDTITGTLIKDEQPAFRIPESKDPVSRLAHLIFG